MKNLFNILFLNLMVSSVFAAQLDDVIILDLISQDDSIELKLQESRSNNRSYFFVRIEKEDIDTYDKLICILTKQHFSNKVKLNLEIPSFSHSPTGSSYPGHSVRFSIKE